ncbi:hypothetical protein VTK56DRAFT_5218 [Thermocarpiscus australiensis]
MLGDHKTKGLPLGDVPVHTLRLAFWTVYAVWAWFFQREKKSPGLPEHVELAVWSFAFLLKMGFFEDLLVKGLFNLPEYQPLRRSGLVAAG